MAGNAKGISVPIKQAEVLDSVLSEIYKKSPYTYLVCSLIAHTGCKYADLAKLKVKELEKNPEKISYSLADENETYDYELNVSEVSALKVIIEEAKTEKSDVVFFKKDYSVKQILRLLHYKAAIQNADTLSLSTFKKTFDYNYIKENGTYSPTFKVKQEHTAPYKMCQSLHITLEEYNDLCSNAKKAKTKKTTKKQAKSAISSKNKSIDKLNEIAGLVKEDLIKYVSLSVDENLKPGIDLSSEFIDKMISDSKSLHEAFERINADMQTVIDRFTRNYQK